MAVLAITMTQGWMIGIICMMGMFGVAAGIFAKKGKNQSDSKDH